jgi:hypothetical protein
MHTDTDALYSLLHMGLQFHRENITSCGDKEPEYRDWIVSGLAYTYYLADLSHRVTGEARWQELAADAKELRKMLL